MYNVPWSTVSYIVIDVFPFLPGGNSAFYGIGGSRSAEGLSMGSGSLTADELRRLDEVRRSLRLEQNDYPPELPPKTRNNGNQVLSGITADYRDSQQYRYILNNNILLFIQIKFLFLFNSRYDDKNDI